MDTATPEAEVIELLPTSKFPPRTGLLSAETLVIPESAEKVRTPLPVVDKT